MKSNYVQSGQGGLATQFNALKADADGGAKFLAHQMLGTFNLATNPTNGKTITLTINSTAITITFVSAIGSTAGNVLIGATAAATCANLIQLLYNPTITNSTQ